MTLATLGFGPGATVASVVLLGFAQGGPVTLLPTDGLVFSVAATDPAHTATPPATTRTVSFDG